MTSGVLKEETQRRKEKTDVGDKPLPNLLLSLLSLLSFASLRLCVVLQFSQPNSQEQSKFTG